MLKSALKTLVLIIAVIGGAVGASVVKDTGLANAGGDAPKAAEKSSKDDGKGAHEDGKSYKKEDKDKKSSDGHGTSDYAGEISYLKFKRQFVIPVMDHKKIEGLVIMNFNLELNDQAPSDSFNMEPKLRDAFMRDLLELSNQGLFSEELTSPKTFEIVRETLLGSSRRIIEQGVENVLILDIARRDSEN
jgi:hypothetical protein